MNRPEESSLLRKTANLFQSSLLLVLMLAAAATVFFVAWLSGDYLEHAFGINTKALNFFEIMTIVLWVMVYQQATRIDRLTKIIDRMQSNNETA